MGSSASKSTRKLPTTTPSTTRPAPSWAGALPAHPPHSPPPPPPAAPAAAAAIISNNAGPSTAARGSDSPPLEYGRRMEAQGAAPISGKSPARFSGEKDDALRRDSLDPQFASNLSRLGQVSIHDAGKFMKAPAPAQRTLNARLSEYTSSTAIPPPGHLSTPMLISLLDQLKTLPPGGDPSRIYKQYGVTDAKMREIRRWVNSPSIGEDEVTVVDGEEIREMKAIWVDTTAR